MKSKQKISRRSFLKTGTGIAASAPLAPALIGLSAKDAPCAPGPLNKWPGRVVINYNNTHAATGKAGTGSDRVILEAMVDDAIKLLTGQTDVGEAWKTLFPTLTTATKIAVKVNFNYNSTIPPHPFLVRGITEGLKKMMVGGSPFPAGNIYMWEANGGGSFDNAGYSAVLFPAPIHRIAQDSLSNHGDGALGRSYANTLYNCDYLINVPGIRGHYVNGACTLGFKSHYGTYSPAYHGSTDSAPYLRDINCLGPVYNKTALTVVGAIYAANEGGGPGDGPHNFHTYALTMDPTIPSTLGRADTLIMSTDPVTAEFQAKKVQKINKGYPYAISNMPEYLRASGGVTGSLSTVYNIGVLNEAAMDVREIFNGDSGTPVHPLRFSEVNRKGALHVSPNPARAFVRVDVTVPAGYRNKSARLEIFGMRGKLVRRIVVPVMGARNRAVWDGADARGKRVTPGKYIVKADLGGRVLARKITLVR